MKFAAVVILFGFVAVHLEAQLYPLTDHYIYNALSINPAFAGSQEAVSATFQYRNQWFGFPDAPKSRILSIHAPVNHSRMGLGLLLSRNTLGIYKETTILGNYAYRHEFSEGTLALGLGFGIIARHVSWNELQAADAGDALLTDNLVSSVLPDFSLGAYYYAKNYFIGISLPLFLSHVPDENTGNYKLKNDFSNYTYFLQGGYEAEISTFIKILPAVLVRYHPNARLQADYIVQVGLKDRIRAGLGYRSSRMMVGMLQAQINEQLRIGYSYDFDFSKTGHYKNGSHEIVLGYIFKYSRDVAGPRQF